MYADESHGQFPLMIFHNMLQNNESIFCFGAPDIIPCASTSSRGQSSTESSSPLKGDSGSSCITEKFPIEDRTKDASVPENLGTKTAAEDGQESVELCEEAEMLSSSTGDDKMDVATTKDAEMKINPKEEKKGIAESKEDIKALIREDLAQIGSVSIIRQLEFIGVEIDIDLSCMSDGSSPKKPEEDSSPSKKTNSPGKPERKRKSPSSSPSKRKKSTDSSPIASESLLTVDYSDPNILDFLAKRLLSIMSCRRTYMEQIHNFFEKFQRDVRDFYNTINNLEFVVENLPMSNESYCTQNLLNLRSELINKAHQMSKKAEQLVEGVGKDADVFKECLKQIDIFEKENVPLLSTKGESILTVGDLKRIELRLKEICKKADDTVILKDERREILLNSSPDFEWLVNHFVKFLIITEMLKPPLLDCSQIGKDK
ncbi:hypothetical protein AVEN_151651-1 [Araneus ventricosus]|uniref:Uncharacterized protein n=1 Tax=Araneus ventricosus TaxID=182803 RepID=A0A4Y2JUB9_ARAVE|nr:hypothetical protein AVEN_151651-1 [Araneus ventricosus]